VFEAGPPYESESPNLSLISPLWKSECLLNSFQRQLSLSKLSTSNGNILTNEVSGQVSIEVFYNFTSVSGMSFLFRTFSSDSILTILHSDVHSTASKRKKGKSGGYGFLFSFSAVTIVNLDNLIRYPACKVPVHLLCCVKSQIPRKTSRRRRFSSFSSHTSPSPHNIL
jgi:hypothetical protein